MQIKESIRTSLEEIRARRAQGCARVLGLVGILAVQAQAARLHDGDAVLQREGLDR